MSNPPLKKLLFLDFDGVLNSEAYYLTWPTLKLRTDDRVVWGAANLDPQAIAALNHVVAETGCEGGGSRLPGAGSGTEFCVACLEKAGFQGVVAGKTLHLNTIRGLEIRDYLKEKVGLQEYYWSPEKTEESCQQAELFNYAIVDDDRDMLYLTRLHTETTNTEEDVTIDP